MGDVIHEETSHFSNAKAGVGEEQDQEIVPLTPSAFEANSAQELAYLRRGWREH